MIKLDESDELAWSGMSSGGGEIMLVTAQGQVIRFAEEEVRSMGLPAGGIAGIKLQGSDRVIGGAVVAPGTGPSELLLAAAAGFARRSPLSEFPTKGRGTQGVAAKLSPKGGPLVSTLLVAAADKLWFAAGEGAVKAVAAKAIPSANRTHAGKVVVVLRSGEQVERVLLVPSGGVEPEPAGGGAQAPARKPARARKPSEPAPVEAQKAAPSAAKAATGSARATGAASEAAQALAPRAAGAKAAAEGAKSAGPAPEGPRVSKPRTAKSMAAAEAVKSPGQARAAAKPLDADEVVSRRGTPAVLARPGVSLEDEKRAPRGRAPASDGGQLLLVPPEPDLPAPKPSTSKATAKTQPPAKPELTAKTQPPAKPELTAKTHPPAKSEATAKTQPPAKTEGKPTRSPIKRELEAEFEPKPKATASRAAPSEAQGNIQTTWSPAPPRRADEAPPAATPDATSPAKKPTRKR